MLEHFKNALENATVYKKLKKLFDAAKKEKKLIKQKL